MSHRTRHFVHALLVVAAVSAVGVWQSRDTQAYMLNNGDTLTNGQTVWSDNGNYYLTYGQIGSWWGLKANTGCWMLWTSASDAYNACGYGSHANQWASGGSAGYAVVQTDGNFVIYNVNHQPVWETNTDGYGSTVFVNVQNDGNIVVYYNGAVPLWSIW